MENLESSTQAGGFQVQLAQPTALPQFVSDVEGLAVEAAADGLQIWIHIEGLQPRQGLPGPPDLRSERVHKGMEATHGGCWGVRAGSQDCDVLDGVRQNVNVVNGQLLPQAANDPLFPGLSFPHSRRLENGAKVVSLTIDDAPLVCLDFWCRAGSVWEHPEESGIAHFLEHMVFKGSRQLAAGEFDHRIEALGGSSNAATGFDDVHFHVLIPPDAAAEALGLLLDLVLAPALRAEAFATERRVVLEELAQSEDQPDEVAVQTLLSRGCPSHNYGLPILGSRERLLAHAPETMARFHQRRYGARHCVLAMSGALNLNELDAVLDRSPLAQLPEGSSETSLAPLRVQEGCHHIALPRLESARMLMLWALPPARQQDAVMGADLLTSLLAEGRRSRLVERLREQLRIVESIDLDLHVMECGSLALLEAVCEPEDLPSVRECIETEWQRALLDPLPEQEWERCLKLVTNGYCFGLESPAAVAALIGSNALWNREQALDHPLKLLEHWTPSTLQQQVVPWMDPRRACVLEAVPG